MGLRWERQKERKNRCLQRRTKKEKFVSWILYFIFYIYIYFLWAWDEKGEKEERKKERKKELMLAVKNRERKVCFLIFLWVWDEKGKKEKRKEKKQRTDACRRTEKEERCIERKVEKKEKEKRRVKSKVAAGRSLNVCVFTRLLL